MNNESDTLTAYASSVIDMPCDVFYAVREHKGKLYDGYWLRIYNDDRTRWLQIVYLGVARSKVHKRKIKSVAKRLNKTNIIQK